MTELTHLDPAGRARMVDVGGKPASRREATARAEVHVNPELQALLRDGKVPKGDVFAAARIAGIQAAKKTGDLIPLCHPLGLDAVEVEFRLLDDRVLVRATARCTGRTGVEMEALSAATVAALTVYDMGKAVDRRMVVGPVWLERKAGGKSGLFERRGLPEGAAPWR